MVVAGGGEAADSRLTEISLHSKSPLDQESGWRPAVWDLNLSFSSAAVSVSAWRFRCVTLGRAPSSGEPEDEN